MPNGDQSSIIRFFIYFKENIFRTSKRMFKVEIIFKSNRYLSWESYPFFVLCYLIEETTYSNKEKDIYHPQPINEHTIFIKQIYQMSLLFSSSLPLGVYTNLIKVLCRIISSFLNAIILHNIFTKHICYLSCKGLI